MNQQILYPSSYNGTKAFTQHQVLTANATGFGAAADDYAERGVDLNEQLVMNKPATFFVKMHGDAMTGSAIYPEDLLIVDRSIKPANNKIVVVWMEGELIVRRFLIINSQPVLQADNKKYGLIMLNEFVSYQCWGVVTCVVHLLDPALIAFNNR